MIQIFFAVVAGVLTIASPCILPLLPILLGVSLGHTSKTRPLFIVAGFVLVFSMAALLLSVLARHTGLDAGAVRTAGIVVLAVFGICMLWSKPFDILAAHISRLTAGAARVGGTGQGNLGGFILGMTLGIVWTPCAGPVLGSVLTLVALQKEFLTAAILLVAYALGAGVPMLVIAYASQYFSQRITSIARYSRALQQIFGVVIILLAVALYFNYDTLLYTQLLNYWPAFNPKF